MCSQKITLLAHVPVTNLPEVLFPTCCHTPLPSRALDSWFGGDKSRLLLGSVQYGPSDLCCSMASRQRDARFLVRRTAGHLLVGRRLLAEGRDPSIPATDYKHVAIASLGVGEAEVCRWEFSRKTVIHSCIHEMVVGTGCVICDFSVDMLCVKRILLLGYAFKTWGFFRS